MRSVIRLRETVRRMGARDEPPSGTSRAPHRSLWAPYSESEVFARKYLTIEAARQLNRSAGLLAAEAWLENAHKYYCSDVRHKALLMPLWASTLSLFVNLQGATDRSRTASATRGLVLLVAAFAGVSEAGFRVRQAPRRPGGRLWRALWSATPGGGAPAALWLSGLLGLFAERVRHTAAHRAPTFLGVHAGRVVGLATAAALIGANEEAGLRPLRGVFQNPFVYIPLMLPPVAAALVARASWDPRARVHKTTRTWLWVTVGAGMVATGLRAYGVARATASGFKGRRSGWAIASIPVPPRSTALALAGLAALGLLDEGSYSGSPKGAAGIALSVYRA